MVELQNLKKMTDLFAENFENFWKIVVLRKIFRAFFSEIISSTPPPPNRPSPIFSVKNFCFPEKKF